MTARPPFIGIPISAALCAFAFSVLTLSIAIPAGNALAQSKKTNSKQGSIQQFEARHKAGDTVAVIEGVVVTFADFNSLMSGYLKTFVARSNDSVITDSLYTVIVDSAWDRAVTDILIEHEIEKRKLRLSVRAIKDSLVADPPDFLRQQFSDSTGTFHADAMRMAFDDPRNDTVVDVIVEGARVALETERLIESVAKKSTSEAARDHAFDAWLKKAKRSATIVDHRSRFGFY